MASKSTRGRKRTRKGQNNDELPPLARQKGEVEEFATLLEPPLEGPFATPLWVTADWKSKVSKIQKKGKEEAL